MTLWYTLSSPYRSYLTYCTLFSQWTVLVRPIPGKTWPLPHIAISSWAWPGYVGGPVTRHSLVDTTSSTGSRGDFRVTKSEEGNFCTYQEALFHICSSSMGLPRAISLLWLSFNVHQITQAPSPGPRLYPEREFQNNANTWKYICSINWVWHK